MARPPSSARGALRVVGEGGEPEPEPRTLDDVFRRYSAYVAAIAHRLLGRDDDVDDVVQDVFVVATRGLGSLREAGALRGWLATVTVRTATRRLKRRRLRAFLHLDDVADYAELAAPGASPEERALAGKLYAVMDKIPAEQRVAWTLRRVEGEKLEDIARMCGCSLATAKRRIDAAEAAIQVEIEDG